MSPLYFNTSVYYNPLFLDPPPPPFSPPPPPPPPLPPSLPPNSSPHLSGVLSPLPVGSPVIRHLSLVRFIAISATVESVTSKMLSKGLQ